MRVLALVHGEYFGAGLFAGIARERGHALVEWESSAGLPPNGDYGAVLVFGGSTHPDEEVDKPWLAGELELLRHHVDAGTPLLGVCLGGQLVARAAGGRVFAADEPERGWASVELTRAAAHDPLFATWPQRFRAFESHAYTWEPPGGAVELARNRFSQAFRVGERAWGVQFHPEVSAPQIHDFIARRADELDDPARVRAETVQHIDRWNELGRRLCGAFLDVAAASHQSRTAPTPGDSRLGVARP